MIVLFDWNHLSNSFDLHHDVIGSTVTWEINDAGSYEVFHYKMHAWQLVFAEWSNKKPNFSSIWTFHVPLTSLSVAMGYQEHLSRSFCPFLDFSLELPQCHFHWLNQATISAEHQVRG